jgi:hypoxanthine phosphoribosyltransferase
MIDDVYYKMPANATFEEFDGFMNLAAHIDSRRLLIDYENPTYDDIHNECIKLVKTITEHTPDLFDCVIGIQNGGGIPANIIARHLNLPLLSISYSSKLGEGDNKRYTELTSLPKIPYRKILLVDDICDSGSTLYEVSKHYEEQGHVVNSFVIHYKYKEFPLVVPFHAILLDENANFVVYPWESIGHEL